MEKDLLKKTGLSEAETKVYNALIKLGFSSLSKIQQNTNIERRYVYDVLNKLTEKGLVSYTIEKGKRTFQITHPNKLLTLLEEKRAKIEETEEELKKELPDLVRLYNEKKPEIKTEIFRGKEGIKAIGEDLLSQKDNYFIGGNGSIKSYMPYFWEHFNKKRIKNKVMWHDLIIEGSLMEEFKSLENAKKELKETQYYEYRILPSELGSPHVISIYGDKVALALWGEFIFALVIQNKEIARSYLNYFNFLWKVAKK